MTELSLINKERSIELGRLIFRRDWLDYLDKIAFSILAAGLILLGVVTGIKIPYDGLFTGFLVFILAPISMILGLYFVYRKVNEDQLICVNTALSKLDNKKRLNQFLTKYGFKIDQQNEDIIIVLDEHMLSYNGLWRKKYVFIITDWKVCFNVRKLYPIISPPVLFGHLFLKSDLKKFMSDSQS